MALLNKTFKYFGYGSNMLKERILISNPTAKFISIGKLKNYRFGFEQFASVSSDIGAIATIRSGNEDDFVMGCVWEIDSDQVSNLDKQESQYKVLEVDVVLSDDRVVLCRTYEMDVVVSPGMIKPHPFYKKICVEGAKQNKLPEEYIKFLESFEDNKEPRKMGFYDALVPVMEQIDKRSA